VLLCTVLGHRLRFHAQGEVLHWRCERCAGASGSKAYPDAAAARRHAAAFDREDRDALGHRPLLSLLPLKLAGHARRTVSREP
jgi:hypothetical protein